MNKNIKETLAAHPSPNHLEKDSKTPKIPVVNCSHIRPLPEVPEWFASKFITGKEAKEILNQFENNNVPSVFPKVSREGK